MTGLPLISEDFTPIFERYAVEPLSFTEAEALRETFWDFDEPARLREDIRFRETPFGRWMRADRWLANDRLYKQFAEQGRAEVDLRECLLSIPARLPLVFCPGDGRFVYEHGRVRLSEAGKKGLPRSKAHRRLDPDALDRRREALRRRLAERWEPVRQPRPPAEHDEEALSSCALVLDDEGLHIVVPPISEEAIPPFVREIVLEVHPQPIRLRVSSLRRGHEEVVPLLTEPYRWTAPGPEAEVLAEVLRGMEVEGLSAGQVTLFDEDEAGRGWRTTSSRVSPGRSYRVLFPPDVRVPDGVETSPAGLWADAWRVWCLHLPDPVPEGLLATLHGLGVVVGAPMPSLDWIVVPPSAWTMACARPAPVFDDRDAPILRVTGMEIQSEGDAILLIVGADECQEIRLNPGREWNLEIAELVAGRYAAELIPRSKVLARTSTYFEVRKDAGSLPPAQAQINPWGDICWSLEDEDLAMIDLCAAEVIGPPCWSVEVMWEGLRGFPRTRFLVGRDGAVQGALADLSEIAREAIHGHLVVSFGEIGTFHLFHFHADDSEEFIRKLEKVVGDAWPSAIPFDRARAERLWLAPICELIGYRLAEAPGVDLGQDALTWRLVRLVEENRAYRRAPAGLLVMARPEADFLDSGPGSARDLAHRACLAAGERTAIVTDGFRWRRFRRKSVPDLVMDLRRVTGDSELASWFRTSLGAEAP